jgi:hypothetical protein
MMNTEEIEHDVPVFHVQGIETLMDWIRRAGAAQGIQPEDVVHPAPGLIVIGQTGVSLFYKDGPKPAWQVREFYEVLTTDGGRRPISRLVATIDDGDLVRVLRVALILVFERSLDIEIAML